MPDLEDLGDLPEDEDLERLAYPGGSERGGQFSRVLCVHILGKILAVGKAQGNPLPSITLHYPSPDGIVRAPLTSVEETLGLSLGAGSFVYYGKPFRNHFKCQISEKFEGQNLIY